MLEPEAAYVEFEEIMALSEGLVTPSCMVSSRTNARARNTEARHYKLENVKPRSRISYENVSRAQQERQSANSVTTCGDEETIISGSFDRPVLIHHYPLRLKLLYAANASAPNSHSLLT